MGTQGSRLAGAAVAAVALCALVWAPSAHASYYNPFEPSPHGDNTQTGQDADCDGNDVAIGGGFAGVGDYADGVYLHSSFPGTPLDPGDRGAWTLRYDDYLGGSPTVTSRVYAMCDSSGQPGDYKIRTEGPGTVADGTQNVIQTACKENETVVGGGGQSDGTYLDETYLATSAPWDDADPGNVPDDGWQVSLNNDEGAAASNSLTGFAVCDQKHKPTDLRYVSRTRTLIDGKQKAKLAPCGKKPILGGGVDSHSDYKHGLYINSSFPNILGNGDRFWVGKVDNYDTPDAKTRKFTVWAICKR